MTTDEKLDAILRIQAALAEGVVSLAEGMNAVTAALERIATICEGDDDLPVDATEALQRDVAVKVERRKTLQLVKGT